MTPRYVATNMMGSFVGGRGAKPLHPGEDSRLGDSEDLQGAVPFLLPGSVRV